MAYTKLFQSLLNSTVWDAESHVRVTWITLLAMADRDGVVESSLPGVAHQARVSLAECEQAIALFLAPDPHSRTTANEGRKLVAVDGGWRLVNYERYRDKASTAERLEKNAARQRRYRERVAARLAVTPTVPSRNDLSREVTKVTHSDSDSDSDSEAEERDLSSSCRSNATTQQVFDAWRSAYSPKAKLDKKRRRLLEARLREGFTHEQLTTAIANVQKSKWHMGENPEGKKYTGLQTILRDAEQVEKFLALSSNSKTTKSAELDWTKNPELRVWLNRRDEFYQTGLYEHEALTRWGEHPDKALERLGYIKQDAAQ